MQLSRVRLTQIIIMHIQMHPPLVEERRKLISRTFRVFFEVAVAVELSLGKAKFNLQNIRRSGHREKVFFESLI